MIYLESIFFILVYVVINVNGLCDQQTGPVGSIECSSNNGFTKKQWNTCLTNNYIQLQSQGDVNCTNQGGNYCTYPCMREVYYARDGNVVDACACNDSLIPPASSLPTECFSPDGSNCDWYRNCFQRQYSCQGTSTGYLRNYAEIFCKLYIKHKDIFTDQAQRWISDGRKCLQAALVPFIRPFFYDTCQAIHDIVIDAFKPCNMKPYPEEASICQITRGDWLRAFWMMKSEYDTSTPTATYVWLQNALDTFYACQNHPPVNDFGHVHQQFQLIIDLIETSWNGQMNLNKDQFDQIAVDIAHRIAKTLILSLEQWGWYAYGASVESQRSSTGYKQMTIILFVADLSGIVNNTLIRLVNTHNTNFNEVIGELKYALMKGDLKIQNDNGTFYVSQMSRCTDMKCYTTTENILAPPYPKNDGSSYSNICFSMMFFLLITLLFFQ